MNETDSSLEAFVVASRPALERALVVRFGLHDGMDAAAEALAYAVREWERVGTMANATGYLYRVGVSSAMRWHRRLHRRDTLLTDASVGIPAEVVDVDLQRALLSLKPEQRVAVVLVHGNGHTYAEAAAVLDVPVTTVTNYIHRGLARLRQLLEEDS